MFLNVSLKSKGKWMIFVFITLVVMLVVSMFFMLKIIDKTENGDVLEGKLKLDFSSYYVQYDMTVISNKNINTYSVKEWHKEGDITKLEYLDYMKNVVTITLQGNTCNISNSGNTAKLVINNMIDNKNIATLSTFWYLYNLDCGSSCCTKTQYVKDKEIIVKIEFKDECDCGCNKIVEDLGVSALELILQNNKPKNYTVLDKNKKEYICIVYNTYEKI